MPLYDQPPPHRITLYSSTASNDAGGGTNVSYDVTPVQSAVPCLINTVSANTQALFAQQNISVSNTIAILSSALTSTPQPGWKAVADDTGGSYHVEGIRSGRQMGTIPAFTYLDVRQILG